MGRQLAFTPFASKQPKGEVTCDLCGAEPIDEQGLIAEFKRTGVRYVCPNHPTVVVYMAVAVAVDGAPPCPRGCPVMELQES